MALSSEWISANDDPQRTAGMSALGQPTIAYFASGAGRL
jgi:hypothetical protein